MRRLIFETSVWLLTESTRLLSSLGHTPRITACWLEEIHDIDSLGPYFDIFSDWTIHLAVKAMSVKVKLLFTYIYNLD